MKIMIRAHDLGVKGEEAICRELLEKDIDGIQLVAYKSTEDVKYQPKSITKERAEQIRGALTSSGKEIALLGAYFNPVHPDEEKISRGIDVFKDYLNCASAFGCNFVGSETGSYNGEPWIYHPMNHSDEALDRVVSVFRELCEYAAEHSAFVAMEGAFGHVCHTPRRLDEAIRRIGRENIRVIIDLYNYLDVSNVDRAYQILDEAISLFKGRILLYHVKDLVLRDGRLVQCGVGRGQLDFEKILTKIYSENPDAILVLEGTTGEDVDYAVSHLRKIINKMTHYSKES